MRIRRPTATGALHRAGLAAGSVACALLFRRLHLSAALRMGPIAAAIFFASRGTCWPRATRWRAGASGCASRSPSCATPRGCLRAWWPASARWSRRARTGPGAPGAVV